MVHLLINRSCMGGVIAQWATSHIYDYFVNCLTLIDISKCTEMLYLIVHFTASEVIIFHKTIWLVFNQKITPHGAGVLPFRLCSSFVHLLPHLLLFITFSLFPFLIHFTYFLLLCIRSLSTRIVPLYFQARGRRRRPNLGLVCFVYYCVICIA